MALLKKRFKVRYALSRISENDRNHFGIFLFMGPRRVLVLRRLPWNNFSAQPRGVPDLESGTGNDVRLIIGAG